MKQANAAAVLARHLTAIGAFRAMPLVVVDVGARAGAHHIWSIFEDQVRVIGFDPDPDECARLNAMAPPTHRYLPHALDRCRGHRDLLLHPDNDAANSFYPLDTKLVRRLYGDWRAGPYRHYIDAANPLERGRLSVETRTLAEALAEAGIHHMDFIKLDVEAAELDVLVGAGPQLVQNLLGVEAEVWFRAKPGGPSFTDVSRFLEDQGLDLCDLDLHRNSRAVLPAPVLGDHRDHHGQRILGYTRHGQITNGDALFMRDIVGTPIPVATPEDLIRVLKAAALFDAHGLPDCAAEILVNYQEEIETHGPTLLARNIRVEAWLDMLAAGQGHAHGVFKYTDYREAYRQTVGRLDSLPAVASPPIYIYGAGKAGRWLKSYLLDRGADFRGFIVSRPDEAGDSEVLSLDTYTQSREVGGLILICSEYHEEIAHGLRGRGVENFINAYPIYLELATGT